MEDSCASAAWWMGRDADLSEIFRDDWRSERMANALANTADIWNERMSTDHVFNVRMEVSFPGELDNYPAATWAEGEDRSTVFGAVAQTMRTPTLDSGVGDDGGAWATMGSVEYEAYVAGGTLSLSADEQTATGSVEARMATGDLAEFDLRLDFDVERCAGFEDAVRAL